MTCVGFTGPNIENNYWWHVYVCGGIYTRVIRFYLFLNRVFLYGVRLVLLSNNGS